MEVSGSLRVPATPRRRAVLLQFRTHAGAEAQERACFRSTGGLGEDELAVFNMAQQPGLRWAEVAHANVLLLGGAGEFSATQRQPFTDSVLEILSRCIDEGRPVLGSCFGHHLIAQVTGGVVETDEASEEVGTFPVRLTGEGRSDPLLRDMPQEFTVQLGHHDRVTTLGPGMLELAKSDRCRFQILRHARVPIYSTQFHAELDESTIRERLKMYRESYAREDGTDSVWERIHPSPFAPELLRRFLDAYC